MGYLAKIKQISLGIISCSICKRKNAKNNKKEPKQFAGISYEPIQNSKLEEVRQKIQQLYIESWQMRSVDRKYSYFVREAENFQQLCSNYSINYSSDKNKLKKICSGYRPIRGDGNCFYTAFGFQFFQIILIEYTNEEFERFLMKVRYIRFRISYQNFLIDDQNLEALLRSEFLYRLSVIRKKPQKDRLEALFAQFSAYQYIDDIIDGCFYGLAVIFMRNLSDLVIENSEAKDMVYDRGNLLIWEKECNSNEAVIQSLANYLNIQIQLVFFDNNDFKLIEYNKQQEKFKMILLMRPGHYNVGIPQ